MSAPLFSPGQVIAGKYTVKGLMGFSGSAATYAAAAGDGRDVAVKVFSPLVTDRPDVLGALQRAAAVTAALPREAASPVLDSGFDGPTRAPYMTSEILASPSLAQTVFRGGALPPPAVVSLVRGMARAVDAAHAQGFVHGALKPQNVFVGTPPDLSVRVIDFGVGVARDAVPTGDGQAIAVPWLAPEQLQGGRVGPWTDVFSAGLVAFFALTGRPFWRSCQGPAPDVAAWQAEILAPRPPPSVRAKEVGSILPPSLDVALNRALSADPNERFRSVGELAEALAAAAAPQPAVPPQFATTAYAPEGLGAPLPGPWAAGGPAPQAQPQPQAPSPSAYGPPPGAPPMQPVGASFPVDAPPRSRKGLFIALGALALAAVGGTAAALVVFGGKPGADGAPSASASALAAAHADAGPTAAAPAPPPAAASAPPSASAAAEPPSTPDAGAPEGPADAAPGGGDEAAAQAQLTVVCLPECETISLDDAGVTAPMTEPLAVDPGPHVVAVGKTTFLGQSRKVTLKPGQVDKETFFLSRPGPAAPKPCGKFLERCPQ